MNKTPSSTALGASIHPHLHVKLIYSEYYHPRLAIMVKATLNGKVLAESNETIVVEGNHYFPPSAVDDKALTPSDTQYV